MEGKKIDEEAYKALSDSIREAVKAQLVVWSNPHVKDLFEFRLSNFVPRLDVHEIYGPRLVLDGAPEVYVSVKDRLNERGCPR